MKIKCTYAIEIGGVVKYIGSTKNFKRRIGEHMSGHKYKGKYAVISELILDSDDDIKFILLEKMPSSTKKERLFKEREHIESGLYRDIVNKAIPIREPWEHKELKKVYNQKNKDKKKEYDEVYRKVNKENKKEYDKVYYQKNKEKKNERKREKITCQCGKEYSRGSKTYHFKTLHHLNNFPIQKLLSTWYW